MCKEKLLDIINKIYAYFKKYINFALHLNNRKYNRFMANHQSSKKRIRQNAKIRLRNRYYKKSARTAIVKLREMTDLDEAKQFLPKVVSMIDKLAKKNTWHKNKASNLKSKLMKHVHALEEA